MDIQFLIATLVPTVATAIVGVILSRQIQSQKEIIDNYKGYIETTDWKKVKDMYEQVHIPELKRQYEKDFSLDVDKAFDTVNKIYNERDDALFLASALMQRLPDEAKAEYLTVFPRIKRLLQSIEAAYGQRTDDPKNTLPKS